jgi:hypothetical protein
MEPAAMTKFIPYSLRRRRLLKGAAAIAALAAAGASSFAAASRDPWARAQDIQRRFADGLSFPPRDYPITAFGARPCELVKVAGYPTIRRKGELETQAPGGA